MSNKLKTTAEHYIYLYQKGDKLLEVILTGRVAKKKRGSRHIMLYEISSNDKVFKDWVKLEQLFTIEEDDK